MSYVINANGEIRMSPKMTVISSPPLHKTWNMLMDESEAGDTVVKAYLRRNVASMKHKLLEMYGPSFVIGRAKANEVNLCLLDVNVSRKHCEFNLNAIDQSWTVTDFSVNGVSVNGKRCQKFIAVSIVNGDKIILSDQKDLYNWTFCVGEVPEADPRSLNTPSKPIVKMIKRNPKRSPNKLNI